MSGWKTVGLVVAGMAIAAGLGGGGYLLYRRYQRKKKGDGELEDDEQPQRVTPSRPPRGSEEVDQRARGGYMNPKGIPDALREVLDQKFPNRWPPDQAVVDQLTTEDQIVFGVESEPVPAYEEVRQEVIAAKVLSVEKTVVRARILPPVAYAEHNGNHAGHGFRVGDRVEVPRSMILVAARPSGPRKKTGYNSRGPAENTFKSSHITKDEYKIRPATPYDLILPYRTDNLEWHIDQKHVKVVPIGHKGLYQQVMLTEDSMRGPVTLRLLNRDPKEGLVFVARWEFHLEP